MSEQSQTNIPRPPQQGKRPSNSVWRGNKYPAVKLRGYYSDVASKENIDKIGVSLQRVCKLASKSISFCF